MEKWEPVQDAQFDDLIYVRTIGVKIKDYMMIEDLNKYEELQAAATVLYDKLSQDIYECARWVVEQDDLVMRACKDIDKSRHYYPRKIEHGDWNIENGRIEFEWEIYCCGSTDGYSVCFDKDMIYSQEARDLYKKKNLKKVESFRRDYESKIVKEKFDIETKEKEQLKRLLNKYATGVASGSCNCMSRLDRWPR